MQNTYNAFWDKAHGCAKRSVKPLLNRMVWFESNLSH